MKIDIMRFEYGSNYTISNLYIDGQRECFVLEDKVRELDGVPVYAWKIPDETAIPKGTYKVIVNHSNRFNRDMPLLLGVPGFAGIRIHQGNTDKNTSGCLLLGTSWVGGNFIRDSQTAYVKFFDKLKWSLTQGQQVELKIGDSLKDFVLFSTPSIPSTSGSS